MHNPSSSARKDTWYFSMYHRLFTVCIYVHIWVMIVVFRFKLLTAFDASFYDVKVKNKYRSYFACRMTNINDRWMCKGEHMSKSALLINNITSLKSKTLKSPNGQVTQLCLTCAKSHLMARQLLSVVVMELTKRAAWLTVGLVMTYNVSYDRMSGSVSFFFIVCPALICSEARRRFVASSLSYTLSLIEYRLTTVLEHIHWG